MEHQGRMRWYNPRLEDFEWREVPKNEQEALSLLDGSFVPQHVRLFIASGGSWGASITVALIRARQLGKKRSTRARPLSHPGFRPARERLLLPPALFAPYPRRR
jgi:hypothetical protein